MCIMCVVFDTFDDDCDGYLDEAQAIPAAYCGGPILFEHQITEGFKETDKLNIGKIDMGQFFILMLRLWKSYGKESAREIFIDGKNAKESKLSIAVKGLQIKTLPGADDIANKISSNNSNVGSSIGFQSVGKPSSRMELPKVKLMSCLVSAGEKGYKPLTVSFYSYLCRQIKRLM
jgi:hypothetical protein